MPTESPIRFSTVGPVSPEDTADASIREFFTVKQVAQRWGVSPDFVRRVFAEEPGVLLFSNQLTRGKNAGIRPCEFREKFCCVLSGSIPLSLPRIFIRNNSSP